MRSTEEEEIANDVVGRIEARCKLDYSACDEYEQAICFVWLATQVIRNGGFEYLFESYVRGDETYAKTAAAFRRIGAVRASAAFDRAMSCFPDSLPPTDLDERLGLFRALPMALKRELDELFMAAYEETVASLFRFIDEAHRDGKLS